MKKKTLFLIFTIFTILGSWGLYAQKELWGVSSGFGDSNLSPNEAYYFGNIIKHDINGENETIVHEFDQVNGKTPIGRLFLASNGKLYGTTKNGGVTSYTNNGTVYSAPDGFGIIYEYDLILNKFRVVKVFDGLDVSFSQIGFIEPTPGILIGATGFQIIKYNFNTGTLNTYPRPVGGTGYTNGEFMKASDGNLYATSSRQDSCPNSSSSSPYLNGSIIKFNPITNLVSEYHLSCDWSLGVAPTGDLVEASPGKLYGTTYNGGLSVGGNLLNNYGVLFEFDLFTNTYTKKIDFNLTTGARPAPLIKALNGKLYGVCQSYGVSDTCFNNPFIIPSSGTLFEYLPQTNSLNVLYNFRCYYPPYPSSIMQASTGDFFGFAISSYNSNLFKYNAVDNVVTAPTSSNADPNSHIASKLIQICRKPSYQEFLPDTFTPSTGSAFTYDIQNTNATTYVWKKGTTVLPLQTTAILNLPNVTSADSGVYTCTMTNECGTTTTMNLFINVDNLGIDLMPLYKNNIKLYPNPTLATLNIELPQSVEIQKCFISNSIGQTVFKSTDNLNKIDVSHLQKGVYIVSLQTNYGKWNGKFVKE